MQIQRKNNYTQVNNHAFGRIWGAEAAIKSLETRGFNRYAQELRKVLPQAEKDSTGVEIFFEDSGRKLDIKVSKKINEKHKNFDWFSSRLDKERYMHLRFQEFNNKETIAPGGLAYDSVFPSKFGEEILSYIKEYKDLYFDWAKKNNI